MSDTLTAFVDDQPVLIEIEAAPARVTRGFVPDSPAVPVARVTNALDSARDTVLNVARKMVTAIQAVDQAVTPDEFELEFSIKFNAEGHAIIAKASGEASLRVRMTYRHRRAE